MRILVTGAAGFIGTHLMSELVRSGHEAYGVDRKDGDLLEPDVARSLIGRYQPEVVIHLAAQVGRVFGESDVAHTIRTNATMTALVAQAATDHDARIVYASTSEVYGDQGELPVHEDSPMNLPYNLYGLTKRWGEEVCSLYGVMPTLLRLAMPFGPGLPAGKGRAAIVNFLWNAHHHKKIVVHRGAERCWCWVGDTVRGIRMVVESNQLGPFNIGRDDNPVTMTAVARMACEIVGLNVYDRNGLIDFMDAPTNQVLVKRLKCDRLRALGWRPEVELAEGMLRTYKAMGLK